ncbi:putative mediator of RNA polymerase II transcription subunit 26 isoform X2 [Culicoides brevitarsis]|uniref:putative mediator of RNA polymerase II transcription subunit 26 isoform X2 n=1 Tax=Culicoides brevitarsis TaxID=469753 RepID=UPI00307C08AC
MTREEFYEFLDLSGVDDSEKDELKSTLYDNNGNSGVDSVGSSSSSNSRSNKSVRGIGIVSPGNHRGTSRGGTYVATNQNRTFRPSTTNYGAQQAQKNVNRPKPTAWVTNRKFQGNVTTQQQQQNQAPPSKNVVVASKRYAYQQQQQNPQQPQVNHKSGNNNCGDTSSSTTTTEHNQGRSTATTTTTNKRNYDVNSDGTAKTAANRRANSANSSYSTESVDYSCDETSYATSTPLSATIEEVVMPRILTPLATIPLYAVVKPTLAATAILQPIIQPQTPATSTNTASSSPPTTKQVPESSVNSECAEIHTESEEQIHQIQATPIDPQQLNTFSPALPPESPSQMINNPNHPGAMSQNQQQQQAQQPPQSAPTSQQPLFMNPHAPYMYHMPMMPQPGNVFVSNLTANVNVHGLMQSVQHYLQPAYVPAQDVNVQNPHVDGQGQPQQQQPGQPQSQGTQQPMNNQMRGQNRRGRARTNSSNSQRREFVPRGGNAQQPEVIPQVIDPQAQMIAAPPGPPYQYYVQYPYSYAPQGQAGVPHPNAHPATTPLYVQHLPMYASPMYGYQPVFPIMQPEYIVDDGGKVVDEQENVPQMWSPNHEYQDPHQMQDGQVQMSPEEYQQMQQTPQQQEELLIAEQELNQQTAQIQIHHQTIPMPHPGMPHSVLNPNVPNFTVVNQPVAVPVVAPVAVQEVVQPPLPSQQPHFANPAPQAPSQDFAMAPQGSISPIAVAQSYANVNQHLAIATSTNENNEQTFIQQAQQVVVIKTVTQIEHEAAANENLVANVDEFVPATNDVVKTNKVPSNVQHQQPSPLPQRVRDTAQNPPHINAPPFVPQSLTKTVSSGSLTSTSSSSNAQSLSQDIPNAVPNQVTSSSSSEKPKEKPVVAKTDRFGGASNAKVVEWNTSKKNTASVSVSAVPAKQETSNNKTATVNPTVNASQVVVKTPAVPFKTGNTSPVPSKSTTVAIPVAAKKEELKTAPVIVQEVKKVEQQNKEVTANVTEKKQTLSLAPPPPPVDENKQAPAKSWASLFAGGAPKPAPLPSAAVSGLEMASKRPIAKVSPFETNATSPNLGAQFMPATQVKPTTEKKPVADEYSLKLSNFLQNYKIDNNSISICPRGLINRSNYCYINGILQALVSCPPFYHLMRDMPKLSSYKTKGCTPILEAMQELITEFQPRKIMREKGTHVKDIELITDTPFEPTVIYKMLNNIRSEIFHVEGRQEDAEEFLGCVLNKLNDEMLEIIKLTDKPAVAVKQPTTVTKKEEIVNGDHNGEVNPDADGDDWQVIGSRNKGTITRTTDYARTPISDIFRGKLRSRVTREGDHSTDNIQPFFTLPLDIERATSVNQALDLLAGRDPLEGITSTKTNQEVTAWQQVTIEELPVVLILHLKCFDYKQDGCTKITKSLEFPVELKIETKLMSNKTKYSQKQRTYKLFAVVYHDGKEASKGHYLTDAFHIGYSSWIRYDDSSVKLVNDNQVLKPIAPRVPYLLCYRRFDTINTAQTNNNNNNNNTNSNNNNNNNSSSQQQRNNYHHK